MLYTKVYVIECVKPNCWYVGSTFRELYDRIDEHSSHCGSVWTRRNGFKRMVLWRDVPEAGCSSLENELTEWLMHQFGIKNVRGGDYVNCRPNCYDSDWWLPKSLRSSLGNVPSLHYRPVSKFPLQLGRLIDAFKVFRRLEHPNHLHPKPLSESILRCVPEQDKHVFSAELVSTPLRAK